MRFALAGVLLALALALAGCGASSPPVGGGASVVPADADAFVAVAAGATLEQLRDVMPREAALVERMRRTVGGEIDVVELHGGKLVALTNERGRWTPTFAGPHLAGAPTYRAAQANVARGGGIRGYLAPGAAGLLVDSLPGQTQPAINPPRRRFLPGGSSPAQRVRVAPRHYRWAAIGLSGKRLTTLVSSTPPTSQDASYAPLIEVQSTPYTAHLLDEIPADATYVADFTAPPSMFENAVPAALPARLRQLIAASPPLPFELDQVIGGETALYRRSGGEVTLVTQPADLRMALGTLGRVVAELRIAVPIRHAVLGGELIVSTSQRGIDTFRGNGPKLEGDSRFRAAAKAAGLPEETTGLVYEVSPARVSWVEHTGGLIRIVSVLR